MTRKRAVTWALVACAASALGCRRPALQGAAGTVSFSPNTLDFGTLFPGQSASLDVEVRNSGRSDLTVSWQAPGAPFTAGALPSRVPAGGVHATVSFQPPAAGDFQAQLQVLVGSATVSLPLHGIAQPIPQCSQPFPCHANQFDLDAGACVDSDLPDGTACDPHDVCQQGSSCQAGRCVGTAKSCDDGNACTVDFCDAVLGCQHQPAPPCPDDVAHCQIGICQPQSGCALAPAADGTVCGPVSCGDAKVCVSGACVDRVPPVGFVCAPASPCQGQGVCDTNGVCQRPPATPLAETWFLDSSADAGIPYNDFVMETSGAVTLLGFFQNPDYHANEADAETGTSSSRRCIRWNDRLACADYTVSGDVGVVDIPSGTPLWTFDLASARPDFAALTSPGHMFMARLASLGSDHLAALFEGYPAGTTPDTLCRVYFLVVLDSAGTMLSAQQVTDPFISVCNHPHPFGVASDVQGDLYIAYSSAKPGGAPLVPLSPTLIIAYSHDGTVKWKQQESFSGGELAVARGLLFPEQATTAFATLDGAPVGSANGGFWGRVVASPNTVTSPGRIAANQLSGFATGSLEASWTYSLPAGDRFLSDQIRLASTPSGASGKSTDAVLAFANRGGVDSLMALDADLGSELWSCPLGYAQTNPPQVFEVAQGSLALMEAAQTCGQCDPPFAGSQASFRAVSVPNLTPALAPWTGTFSNASHDHHEALTGAPPDGGSGVN